MAKMNISSRNKSSNKAKLCSFGYVDYIVLASSLAIALAEELNANELNILATLLAVLSDELALISTVESSCSNNQNNTTFVPPIPTVGDRSTIKSDNLHNVENCKRKIIRKKRRKIKKK